MLKGINMKDETKNKNNLIPFEEAKKALRMGTEPPEENWLKNLSVGTVFSAKQKLPPTHQDFNNPFVDTYKVDFQGEVTTKLIIYTGLQTVEKWVDTLQYSRIYTKLEVYGVFDDESAEDSSGDS